MLNKLKANRSKLINRLYTKGGMMLFSSIITGIIIIYIDWLLLNPQYINNLPMLVMTIIGMLCYINFLLITIKRCMEHGLNLIPFTISCISIGGIISLFLVFYLHNELAQQYSSLFILFASLLVFSLNNTFKENENNRKIINFIILLDYNLGKTEKELKTIVKEIKNDNLKSSEINLDYYKKLDLTNNIFNKTFLEDLLGLIDHLEILNNGIKKILEAKKKLKDIKNENNRRLNGFEEELNEIKEEELSFEQQQNNLNSDVLNKVEEKLNEIKEQKLSFKQKHNNIDNEIISNTESLLKIIKNIRKIYKEQMEWFNIF
jgi:hypothetical protein